MSLPAGFPSSLDSLANPTATTNRDDPGFELDAIISRIQDILEALEAKVGIGASLPSTAGVLRRTAPGATAWGALAAGDIAPQAIGNLDINNAAAITYGKLALAASIQAADLAAGTGMRKLADTTLGAAAATVDFPNISQAYASLYIVGTLANTATGGTVLLRYSFDGTTFDATTSYDWIIVSSNNNAVTGVSSISQSGMAVAAASNTLFAPFVCEIPLYSSTGYHHAIHARYANVQAQTAAGYFFNQSFGLHRTNTSGQIRGVQFVATTGTVAINSRIIIFGLPATLG